MYFAGHFLCEAVISFVVCVDYIILLLCVRINSPSSILQTCEMVPESVQYPS